MTLEHSNPDPEFDSTICGETVEREDLEFETSVRARIREIPSSIKSLNELSQFGKHRIVDVLARNSNSQVLLAFDAVLKRNVVLKVYLSDRGYRPERIIEEAQRLCQVNSPHVVRCFNVEQIEGHHVLILEHLQGQTLTSLVAAGPVTERRALAIVAQIAQGLAAIHEQGLLHLDLKPDNVILTDQDQAVIIDFGNSRIKNEAQFGGVSGTPSFMAPEMARGDLMNLGEATDVFGLGALLLFLVSGSPPFRSDNGEGSLALSRVCELSVAEPEFKSYSTVTRDLLTTSLSANPSNRPVGAMDVHRRIERDFQKRSRLFKLVVSGAILLMALAVGYGFSTSRFAAPPKNPIAVRLETLLDQKGNRRPASNPKNDFSVEVNLSDSKGRNLLPKADGSMPSALFGNDKVNFLVTPEKDCEIRIYLVLVKPGSNDSLDLQPVEILAPTNCVAATTLKFSRTLPKPDPTVVSALLYVVCVAKEQNTRSPSDSPRAKSSTQPGNSEFELLIPCQVVKPKSRIQPQSMDRLTLMHMRKLAISQLENQEITKHVQTYQRIVRQGKKAKQPGNLQTLDESYLTNGQAILNLSPEQQKQLVQDLALAEKAAKEILDSFSVKKFAPAEINKAIENLERARSSSIQALGETSIYSVNITRHLALLFSSAGRHEQAETVASQLQESVTKLQSEKSDYAKLLSTVPISLTGDIYLAQSRFHDAANEYRKCFDIFNMDPGFYNDSTYPLFVLSASRSFQQGNYFAEAMDLEYRLYKFLIDAGPVNPVHFLSVVASLVENSLNLGDLETAEFVLHETESQNQEILDFYLINKQPFSADYALAIAGFWAVTARLAAIQGNHEQAIDTLVRAQRFLIEKFVPGSPADEARLHELLATLLIQKARSSIVLNQLGPAGLDLKNSLEFLEKPFADRTNRIQCYLLLAEISVKENRFQPARKQLELALNLERQASEPIPINLCHIHSAFARLEGLNDNPVASRKQILLALESFSNAFEKQAPILSETEMLLFKNEYGGLLSELAHQTNLDDPLECIDLVDQISRCKNLVTRTLQQQQNLIRTASADEKTALSKIRTDLAAIEISEAFGNSGDIKSLDTTEKLRELEIERRFRMGSLFRSQGAKDYPAIQGLDLKQGIDPKSAIVEFIKLNPVKRDPNSEQYLAFVLSSSSTDKIQVKAFKLGNARIIDELLNKWHSAGRPVELAGVNRGSQVDGVGDPELQFIDRGLDELASLVWKPIQSATQGHENLILCPDDMLWLMPWAGLKGTKGTAENEYLINDHVIALAACAADALKTIDGAVGKSVAQAAPIFKLALVGNIDYGGSQAEPGQDPIRQWRPLPASHKELNQIQKLAEQHVTHRLEGDNVTPESLERLLRDVNVLHFAGHSFAFGKTISLRPFASQSDLNLGTHGGSEIRRNLLCRSGMVLAGINNKKDESASLADSLFLSEQLLNFDLNHIRLAVLSSCDSGAGTTASFEGVFGLQKALHMSGVDTTITSLIRVDDEKAAEFMSHFYRAILVDHLSHGAALRAAQLAMIRSKHPPRLWANWILQGDWKTSLSN